MTVRVSSPSHSSLSTYNELVRQAKVEGADYPSYELFTDALREGVFRGADAMGRQLRLVVGTDRKVKEVYKM